MKEIPAKLVAELRARTGAGMMDCKKALQETGGELEKAIDLLRQRGAAKADKRAGREASEGLIGSFSDLVGEVPGLRSPGSVGRPDEEHTALQRGWLGRAGEPFADELGPPAGERRDRHPAAEHVLRHQRVDDVSDRNQVGRAPIRPSAETLRVRHQAAPLGVTVPARTSNSIKR